MSRQVFTCPRCGRATTDQALARLGYCAGPCREFTGLCGAGHVAVALLATALVSAPGWHHPCIAAGPERWRVTGIDGTETVVVLCPAHAGQLRRGGMAWIQARGVRLAFLGTCGGGGGGRP